MYAADSLFWQGQRGELVSLVPHLLVTDLAASYAFGFASVSAKHRVFVRSFGGEIPDTSAFGATQLKASLFGELWGIKGAFSVFGDAPSFGTPPFLTEWQGGAEVAISREFGPFQFAGSLDVSSARIGGTTAASWRIFEPLSVTLEARWLQMVLGSLRWRVGRDWVVSAYGGAAVVSVPGLPRYQTGLVVQFDPVLVVETPPVEVPPVEVPPPPQLAFDANEVSGMIPNHLVKALQKRPNLRLRIEMYVSAEAQDPDKLAEANAEVIFVFLQKQGIERERLEILPMGVSTSGNKVIFRVVKENK